MHPDMDQCEPACRDVVPAEKAGETPGADSAALVAFLATRDVACPGCSYSLLGLQADRCPECNRSLRLWVVSEPRGMAAYVNGVIGLSLGMGLASFALAYQGFSYLQFGFTLGTALIVVLFSMIVVHALLLVVWCRRRERIGRLSAGGRWSLVGLAYGLSTVSCSLFFVMAA